MTCALTPLASASRATTPCMRSLSIEPGHIALTRMLCSPSSMARLLVSPMHPPLGCGVGGAEGEAQEPRGRGDVHDGPSSRAFERRNRPPDAVELAGEVHLHGAAPVFGANRFHPGGRPRDARVVDQHVEPAERRQRVLEERIDGFRVAHVGEGGGTARLLAALAQGAGIDIADVHLRSALRERGSYGAAYPASTSGDQDLQTGY